MIFIDAFGITGPIGNDGYIGQMGFNGPIGHTGVIGSTGLDGDIGSDGPIGNNGQVGSTGLIGYIGPTGIDGIDGYPGPTGIDGIDGPTGIDGTVGHIGSIGPSGSFYYIHAFQPVYGSGSDIRSNPYGNRYSNISNNALGIFLSQISDNVTCLTTLTTSMYKIDYAMTGRLTFVTQYNPPEGFYVGIESVLTYNQMTTNSSFSHSYSKASTDTIPMTITGSLVERINAGEIVVAKIWASVVGNAAFSSISWETSTTGPNYIRMEPIEYIYY